MNAILVMVGLVAVVGAGVTSGAEQCGLSPCVQLDFANQSLDVQQAYASGGLE